MKHDRTPDPPALSGRARRTSLGAIIAAIAVVGVMLGLTLPLLSLVLAGQGVDSRLIGLSAATASAAIVLASPFIPRVIARIGLVPMMLGAVVLEILSLIALPAIDNVYGWFPVRFVMGFAAASLFVGTEAWISRVATNETRGRIVGLYAAVLSAGLTLGPALIPMTGIQGFRPFLLAAAILALAIPFLLLAAPSAPRLDGRPAFGVLGLLRLAPAVAGAVALFGLIDGTNFALLAPYLVEEGLQPGTAAAMLSVGGLGAIALQVPIGWLADRHDRRRVMGFCALACLVLPLALPVAGTHLFLLGPILFVWLGFAAGLYTVALAIVGERFAGTAMVTANAALALLYGLGSMTGPTLTGAAMDRLAETGFPLALAAASLVFLALFLWVGPAREKA